MLAFTKAVSIKGGNLQGQSDASDLHPASTFLLLTIQTRVLSSVE